MFNRKIWTISWKIHTPYEWMFWKSWYEKEVTWTRYIDLTDAIANKLLELKVYGWTELLPETYLDTVTASGGCRQSNLPEGYTQVEYLEVATTNAYFLTGINATIDTDMGITASNLTSSSAQILVAQCESGSDYFRIAKAGASQRIIGSLGSSTVTDNNTDGASKFTARVNKSWFYVDGSLIGTFSNIPSSLTDIGKIDIFRGKYSDTVYYAYTGSRFHSAWVDDNIFLPCRRNSDNQLGIYNTKTGQFILPSGNGTFIAGPDVVPSPSTPMDIVCNNGVLKCNTNIFTTTGTTQDKYIDANGTETDGVYTGYSFGHTNYLKVKPNTTYTVSGVSKVDKVTNHWVSAWSSNKTFIERPVNLAFPANSIGNEYSVTFTTTAETEYIIFNYVYTVDEEIKIYLNAYSFNGIYTQGTQEAVTDSLGNTANAERLLAVGNDKDTQEVISGSVTRNVGVLVLDGTESWLLATGTGYRQFYISTTQGVVKNSVSLVSTIAPYGCTAATRTDYDYGCYSGSTGYLCFQMIGSSTLTTVAEFKQFLANQYANGTPVVVVYPLATATTESVTGQFLSKSPVTQTAGSISNLPIAITESQKTIPTPLQPLQINCNNGVVKVSKNVFDYEYFYDNYQIYVGTQVGRCPIKLQPNTQYTVSTNTEASSSSSKVFVRSGSAINWTPVSADNGVLVNGPRTVTTDSDGYLCIGIYCTGVNEVPESDFVNGTVWVQIEQGSTATTYRPYGIYVDGTTETVEITGKNLFNKSIFAGDSSDTVIYTSYSVPNGTYTMSSPDFPYTGSVTNVFFLAGNVSDGALSAGNGVAINKSITITVTDGYYTIGHRYVSGGNLNNAHPIDYSWQIEQGSIATTYEPYYNGGTATAENLFKIGTNQDVQSIIDGGVTRNIGIKVLDGSENWFVTGGTYLLNMYNLIISDMYTEPSSVTSNRKSPYSTHFERSTNWITSADRLNKIQAFQSSNQNVLGVGYPNPTTANLPQFKSWLADQYNAGTPVIVVYPLAEPTTETVTPQPMNIQEWNNRIEITQASMDNLELSAKYKSSQQ